MDQSDDILSISRRAFLVVSGAATLPSTGAAASSVKAQSTLREIKLKVNGRTMAVELEPRVTLLDFLRDRVGLTGTKKGCNEGACRTCTVLVDGKRMNAC